MKSYFTISTEFSGEDNHKQQRRMKCDEKFPKIVINSKGCKKNHQQM